MSRRRHRTNAARIELVLHVLALVVGFTLLGALTLAGLPWSRS